MTLEELALSKKVVVCPQCLNEFLAQGVDIPATMLRTHVASTRASRQIYCHSCGESLPVAGLRFCPYCGASQSLEVAPPTAAGTPGDAPVATPRADESQLPVDDRTVVEDDAHDMMSQLPLIRPIPHMRSKREVMGGPVTRFVCYTLIILLIAIFLFLIFLTNYDEDGSVARSLGLNF